MDAQKSNKLEGMGHPITNRYDKNSSMLFKIVEKLKSMLKRWAEGEFSKDAQYSLIPSLYSNLKKEGMVKSVAG